MNCPTISRCCWNSLRPLTNRRATSCCAGTARRSTCCIPVWPRRHRRTPGGSPPSPGRCHRPPSPTFRRPAGWPCRARPRSRWGWNRSQRRSQRRFRCGTALRWVCDEHPMNPAALFWDIAPYVTIAILVVGTWWRYRYDKFGWTTRSSQLYESRLLRIGSPLFHFGILVVIIGHVIGLLIPESWTSALGLSEQGYHLQAVALGSIAGIATLGGAAILVYRRRTKGPVFIATTRNDKLMYAVLILAIIAGLATTLIGSGAVGDAYNYRESVSVWFRSILILQPDGEAMAQAPASYQIHAVIGMALFALWPFTRLVHAFSAPIGYLFRPYIVYRSRDAARPGEPIGSRPRRRGW